MQVEALTWKVSVRQVSTDANLVNVFLMPGSVTVHRYVIQIISLKYSTSNSLLQFKLCICFIRYINRIVTMNLTRPTVSTTWMNFLREKTRRFIDTTLKSGCRQTSKLVLADALKPRASLVCPLITS